MFWHRVAIQLIPIPPNGGFSFLCCTHLIMITETIAWLDERASKYGGTAADILDKTPSYLWDNPDELRAFWDTHDLSHVFPRSTYPWLSDDWNNIVAESSSVNRARGGDIMTHGEMMDADLQSEIAALDIDATIGGDDPMFASELMDVVFA